MKMTPLPSCSLLNELLILDVANGELRWKVDYGRGRSGRLAGSMRGDGYRAIKIDGVDYRVHRIVFKITHGRDPGEIDHRHGKVSDAPWNLREASRQQNNQNVPRRKDNTSGFKGVSWHKKKAKWQAMIGHQGKQRQLGTYHTKEQAYAAYCAAAQQLHGDFARLA
jgi:hypothetical protein